MTEERAQGRAGKQKRGAVLPRGGKRKNADRRSAKEGPQTRRRTQRGPRGEQENAIRESRPTLGIPPRTKLADANFSLREQARCEGRGARNGDPRETHDKRKARVGDDRRRASGRDQRTTTEPDEGPGDDGRRLRRDTAGRNQRLELQSRSSRDSARTTRRPGDRELKNETATAVVDQAEDRAETDGGATRPTATLRGDGADDEAAEAGESSAGESLMRRWTDPMKARSDRRW